MPGHDVHQEFIEWAAARCLDDRSRKLFLRMATRGGIEQRWSVLSPRTDLVETAGFYGENWPSTADRMLLYANKAPALALEAIATLGKNPTDGVTHLIVASCTGFMAPGLDQILAMRLGLSANVERLMIGYMGCYAAAIAVRAARHIIRSDPGARVLVVCIELCTLHLQDSVDLESLLAMFQFGDGAAAALISADPKGLAIGQTFSAALPDSGGLIRWDMGNHGFAMHLSGAVPAAIADALAQGAPSLLPVDPARVGSWAVHPGGRSILDAVESGLGLPAEMLHESRSVLRDYANMSSATLLFVLARILRESDPACGVAMAFGPGVAIEGFTYGREVE